MVNEAAVTSPKPMNGWFNKSLYPFTGFIKLRLIYLAKAVKRQPTVEAAKIAAPHSRICPDWKSPQYCPRYELAAAAIHPSKKAMTSFPGLIPAEAPG